MDYGQAREEERQMYFSLGTFPKNINYQTCIMFAQRAMQRHFVDPIFDPNIVAGEYYAVGFGSPNFHPGILVIVNCVPRSFGTWVELFVITPNDPAKANALRNAIRSQIIAASIFDPPPLRPF